MIGKLKEATGSYWARSRAFRLIIIVAFFLFMGVAIFLLYWYARTLLGYSVNILIIIAILVFWYVARKEGYVEKAKELSPKYYYYARRVECIVGGGLLTGFTTMTMWRLLIDRPLPSYSFLLFLILIVVGAYIGDKVGRKLKVY